MSGPDRPLVDRPMSVLGLHEYADTATGLMAIDAATKAAPVEVVTIRVINPGKLVAVVTGDEAAVELSLAASRKSAGSSLVDELFLTAVHPGVISALTHAAWETWDALCIVETATIATGIAAADLAAKTAAVTVAEIRIDDSMGGRASIRLVGPIGEIDVASSAATEYAAGRDALIRAVTIANPHEDLRPHLIGGGAGSHGDR